MLRPSFLPLIVLVDCCRGLAPFGGGVRRIGTLDINGDAIAIIPPTPTTPSTTTTSRTPLLLSTRASGRNDWRGSKTSAAEARTTNWADRGTYIDREVPDNNHRGARLSATTTTTTTTTTNEGTRQQQQQQQQQQRVSSEDKINLLDRPADTPLYCLNVCLRIKPERRAEFLRCISANQLGTLTTEPLAVTYVYGEDETDSDTWRFFEQYAGKDGFDAHRRTPHFAKWEEFASTDPFAAPPEVRFFEEDSSGASCLGSRMVRDALLAFGGDGRHATARLFCLDVTMTVRPEKRDAFLDALRADQRGAVTSEPNAVSYLFGEDDTTPNVFHMFEAYSGGGRGGFEEHARTEHYGKWAEFKVDEEPFSSPPVVGYYEIQLPYGVSS